MKVPLSWIKDFVDINLPLDDLARLLTMAGLEVDEVLLVGLPEPRMERREFKFTGISWDPEKIVVAQVDEVMPHPNADRLVLCTLNDGQQVQTVLTGAPNLYPYKGQGPLPKPIKVAYAKEGAKIYDGHQPGQVLTTLKRAKIRGVESYSMVCSEKELGISEEHEGVIFLDDDAPTGMPLVDYMGDAVFDISILPNMSRNACVLGVAREIAAVAGLPLRKPTLAMPADGPSIEGKVAIQITDPTLNQRFMVGLVCGVEPRESPYKIQRRLRMAGMRAINSIVDATNYIMLEVGQPLHAFDYDVLVKRAAGKTPTIITRPALQGEKLVTLDNVERTLDSFTIMVTDTAGPLSLAGVMGGQESEVTDQTRNILLEGASWNFINIRRTVMAQKLPSEAAYRFSRGVHPALSEDGVRLGMDRMAAWGGGKICAGVVDNYPLPPKTASVTITPDDVRRILGIELTAQEIAGYLSRLEFTCTVEGNTVRALTPPHRLDIGEGVIGTADLLEEVARMYGYDNIPYSRLSDDLPPQRGNIVQENEDRLKDILAGLELQEVITYRMTSVEREARLVVGEKPAEKYVHLQNPITPDRSVMRRSLLSSVLDVLERNIRLRERLAFFEVGPVFHPKNGQQLPEELPCLVIAMSGQRRVSAWDQHEKEPRPIDFYDLKGTLENMFAALHMEGVTFEPGEHPSMHPGKCARLRLGEIDLGTMGELHPLVKERYDFGTAPVLVAEIWLNQLFPLAPWRYDARPVSPFPPVLEDIAVVVDDVLTAGIIEETIRKAGGKLVTDIRLFDIFRGEQLGAGKKSMAYSLTYQAADRTLTDGEAAKIRQRIIRALEQELGAKLRS